MTRVSRRRCDKVRLENRRGRTVSVPSTTHDGQAARGVRRVVFNPQPSERRNTERQEVALQDVE